MYRAHNYIAIKFPLPVLHLAHEILMYLSFDVGQLT